MISEKILKRLKKEFHFFHDTEVSIEEKQGDGRGGGVGTITLQVHSPCLCVRVPAEPIRWLSTKSCGDSIIFEFNHNIVHLHLLEMKSRITLNTWQKAKVQIHGAYLNALAMSGVLGIGDFGSVTVHIAYKEDSLHSNFNATPVVLKVGLGDHGSVDVGEWITRRVAIQDVPTPCDLRLIIRDGAGDGKANLRDVI